MRPYIAILIDSFRAALASRVLYVLLALITLFLLVLAPFVCTESLDWEIQPNSSSFNVERVVRKLVGTEGGEKREPSVEAIWQRLPEELQKEMKQFLVDGIQEEEFQVVGPDVDERSNFDKFIDRLCFELNWIIQDRDFYQPEDWNVARLPAEAKGLLDSSTDLTEIRSRRLNRLLVSHALDGAVPTGANSLLEFHYGPFEVTSTTVPHQQIAQYIGEYTPWFFDKFVMSIGLLIAIVVTANLIPETFDPGSLNLLLSKPISRSGLLLAKFAGGCAFTTILATYLLVGMYGWLGLRLGVWENSILYSVPLYLLVFAIYYSVSAVSGIRFRSAILSVVFTAVFWGLCFMVGTVYYWLNNRMENTEISRIVTIGDKALAIDPMFAVLAWDEAKGWDTRTQIFDANGDGPEQIAFGISTYIAPELDLPPVLSPVYDETTGLMFSSQIRLGPSRSISCMVADGEALDFEKYGNYPQQPSKMFSTPQGLIVISRSGELYRMSPELVQEIKSTPDFSAKQKLLRSKAEEGLFEKTKLGLGVSPGRRSDQVDFNWEKNELVIYSRGEITIFGGDPEYGYLKTASLTVDTGVPKNMSCRLRAQGNAIVLVLGNGEVIQIDRESLTETRSYLPETRSKVKQMSMSRDGKWLAVAYANERLWTLNIEQEKMQLANVGGQGKISGVGFNDQNQMWVADRNDRMKLYEPEGGSALVKHAPQASPFKMVYRYLVRPIYLVFPKPSEVYKVVTHISSTRDTTYNRNVDLSNSQEAADPWSPLWSGLGFMAFMLFLGCVLFNYADF